MISAHFQHFELELTWCGTSYNRGISCIVSTRQLITALQPWCQKLTKEAGRHDVTHDGFKNTREMVRLVPHYAIFS